MNRWLGIGRLTANPDLKYTNNNIPVTKVNIAIDRGNGDKKTADFIPVVAFRKTAELIAQYLNKGSLVAIEGSLSTRTYDDKDGNKRFVMEVIVDNIKFLESKKKENKDLKPSDFEKIKSIKEEYWEKLKANVNTRRELEKIAEAMSLLLQRINELKFVFKYTKHHFNLYFFINVHFL